MEITEIGASIRQARIQAGLTQAQLAERLGTTQSVVARWEHGGAEPRLSTLLKVGRATGAWVDLQVVPAVDPHDWSLVESGRRLTPDERLSQLIGVISFVEDGRAAMREAKGA